MVGVVVGLRGMTFAVRKQLAQRRLESAEVRWNGGAKVHVRRPIRRVVVSHQRSQYAAIVEQPHLDVLSQDAIQADPNQKDRLFRIHGLRPNSCNLRAERRVGAGNPCEFDQQPAPVHLAKIYDLVAVPSDLFHAGDNLRKLRNAILIAAMWRVSPAAAAVGAGVCRYPTLIWGLLSQAS